MAVNDPNIKEIRKALLDVAFPVVFAGKRVKKATKFLSTNFVVRATRLRKQDLRDRSDTFVVTVGRPNYLERAFIKSARKSGEPFPIKRVQFKGYPIKRV